MVPSGQGDIAEFLNAAGQNDANSITELTAANVATNFSSYYQLDGYIELTTSVACTFRLNSDDGSVLSINGSQVINDDGEHAVVSPLSDDTHTYTFTPPTTGSYAIAMLFRQRLRNVSTAGTIRGRRQRFRRSDQRGAVPTAADAGHSRRRPILDRQRAAGLCDLRRSNRHPRPRPARNLRWTNSGLYRNRTRRSAWMSSIWSDLMPRIRPYQPAAARMA